MTPVSSEEDTPLLTSRPPPETFLPASHRRSDARSTALFQRQDPSVPTNAFIYAEGRLPPRTLRIPLRDREQINLP